MTGTLSRPRGHLRRYTRVACERLSVEDRWSEQSGFVEAEESSRSRVGHLGTDKSGVVKGVGGISTDLGASSRSFGILYINR
jgi:hypothetical protein